MPFFSKITFPKILLLVSLISVNVDSPMSFMMVKCVRNLDLRIGEHVALSPFIKKQVKPKNCSIDNHLLFCNHVASFDGFSILMRVNKKFILELKENLVIMRDRKSLNGTLHWHHCTYSGRPSNKVFVRILFVSNSCHIILI